MRFAVNYSRLAADLLRRGLIDVDYFKCPAWPELITEARQLRPVYVHLPLRVGPGIGDALDTEANRPADWRRIEALVEETGTPLINVHLAPLPEDYADLPPDFPWPERIEVAAARMLCDLVAVVRRFGPARVVAENDINYGGEVLRPSLLPAVIQHVVKQAGCGLLLDVSHARLAALQLGMDAWDYIRALPLERTREVHITGLQRVSGHWLERLQERGADLEAMRQWIGQMMDHLPLTAEDWPFAASFLQQARRGACGKPWVVTFECGGVGAMWEAFSDEQALADQIPRLGALVKGSA